MATKKLTALALAGAMALGSLAAGCGQAKISSTEVAATLGDTGVTVPLYMENFMVKFTQSRYDIYLGGSYGDDMWEQDIYSSGSTLTEDVKSNVIESLE